MSTAKQNRAVLKRLSALSVLFGVFVAASASASSPALAQDIAVTNATVATGDGSGPISGANVVVRGGKVVAAGPGVAVPSDMRVIDGTGKWVTPGLVAAVTDIGLWDVSGVSESNDTSASGGRFGAALDAAPAINPSSQHIAVSRAGGITRAGISIYRSNSVFAGQGAIIDTGSDADAVMRPRAFQSVEIGETGASIAGGSRIATHVELRNALREARDYAAGRWSGEDNLLPRADAEALGAVISGSQKLFVRADRAADIRQAIALKREFPKLDLVIVGATGGWQVAGELAAAKVPVLASSLQDLPEQFEQLAATQSNIGRMADAGVTVAINANMLEQPRYLAQTAGNLVALANIPRANGLSWGRALAAITSVPARILGLSNVGMLSPGARGDVVIWDGDPLEVSSAPVQVFIDGVEQPLTNHQTRLRERYRDLDESDLPKAYDW